MLKLLLALVAFLAMRVTATNSASSGTDIKLVDALNPTIPTVSKVEYEPCNIDGNNKFGQRCYCFSDPDNIYAVDRHWMVDAITAACGYFTGGIGEPVSEYGTLPGLAAWYTYTHLYPAPGDAEEGRIIAALSINTNDPACAGPRPVGWGECWDMLHIPLDRCDTSGEDNKNGGIYLHDCLYWVLDPAPSQDQPYSLEGLACGSACDDPDDKPRMGEAVTEQAGSP